MKKFKILLFSVLSCALVCLFGFEIFAAVYLNMTINGQVEFYATDIGASVFCTYSHNTPLGQGSSEYLVLSGNDKTSVNGVYEIVGSEASYANIIANMGSTTFTTSQDELEIYVFLKNVGSRYILPNVSVNVADTNNLVTSVSKYYFDVSTGHKDPLTEKSTSANATSLVSTMESEISNTRYSSFGLNSSIDNNDTWCARVSITINPASVDNFLTINSSFQIVISFMADVQYNSNNILSVYQPQNQTDPAWTKYGYNATLSANATKVETNSLSTLQTYLENADANGNANITYGVDDYINAVVYKDIDLVNVDIATGEIIGKLSDLTYDFEWYGRDITLPAGRTLASGRTLETSETFRVDVYTYYPTMYIRRWVVGDRQWISLSDQSFSGAVEIPEYYTATFEATTFSPVVDATTGNVTNYTIAYNSYGIIPRSYVYEMTPLVSGANTYLINNYRYKNNSSFSSVASTTQSQMILWSTNLTKAWEDFSLSTPYKSVNGVQGENYTTFVYNLLYLVKYANNNSQEMVGYGNTFSYSIYNTSGVKLKNRNGGDIVVGGADTHARYESDKGGGTIGVYNASQKNTASYYNTTDGYRLSAAGYDSAGMNYGYNSEYVYSSSS